MKFGLLGHPLGHSLSPFIHNEFFRMANAEAQYSLIDMPEDELQPNLDKLFELEGFNVTIPYKKKIVEFLDELDSTADRYASVNVVKTGKKNVGYNTDVIGFLKSIECMGANLSGKVLLLGSGGVAQMMAVETVRQSGQLTVAVRDEKSPKVAEFVQLILRKIENAKVSVCDINNIMGDFDIMLNATSVGMYPNEDVSPVEERVVKRCKFVFDAIYNPPETLLSQFAKRCGVKCKTGMEMLVRQAAEAENIWNGWEFDDKQIEEVISKCEGQLVKI